MNSISRDTRLPTELLHIAVSHLAADYLDDLVAGELSLAHSATPAHIPPTGPISIPLGSDETLERSNPIISLLLSSVQLRAVTLSILSTVLNIPIIDRDGIQGLATKPWSHIQPLRYIYAYPASLSRIKQAFEYQKVLYKSGLMLSYTLLALYRLKLEQSKTQFDSPILGSDLFAFWNIKDYVEALPDDTVNIMTVPLAIKNAVFASKVYGRIKMWGAAMAQFITLKAYVRICAHAYDLTCRAELCSVVHHREHGEVNWEKFEDLVSVAHERLASMLKGYHTIVSVMITSTLGIASYGTQEQITSARKVFHSIGEHHDQARERSSYDECRTLARKMIEWLDDPVKGPGPKPRAESHVTANSPPSS